MANLDHGPTTVVPRAPAPEQSHVRAFFQPVDDAAIAIGPNPLHHANAPAPSGTGAAPLASIGPRDSSAVRAFNSPFTFTPSASHARPPPFPAIAPNGTSPPPLALHAPSPSHFHSLSEAQAHAPHPSTFEGAKGLMLMRQSAEPSISMAALSRPASTPSPVPAPAPAAAPAPAPVAPAERIAIPVALSICKSFQPPALASTPAPDPLPKVEFEAQTSHSAHDLLHPTISSSSEEYAGRHSDVSSVGENSDTITDPDIDLVERSFQALPRPPISRPLQPHVSQTSAAPPPACPAKEWSGSNSFPTQQPLFPASVHASKTGSMAAPNGSVVDGMFQSTQAAAPTSRKPYDPTAPILPVHGIRCHCRAVPEVFLNILDEKSASNPTILATIYGACKDDLCPLHINAYARLITSACEAALAADPILVPARPRAEEPPQADEFETVPVPAFTGAATQWTPMAIRRRRTSTPGIYEYEYERSAKRRRVGAHTTGTGQSHQAPPCQPAECPSVLGRRPQPGRPHLNPKDDDLFRRKVLTELEQSFTDRKEDEWSRGETTNRYIHAILSKCQHPNTNLMNGPVDAGFLSGSEAAHIIERGTERIPIFTEGQQQFTWDESTRPIAQLFHRMEDLTREVSVQIPSHDFDVPSYETKSLTEIRDRFISGRSSQDPWNILDLRSPLPPAILPRFLTGENCQLLPRIRDSLLEGHSAERTKANREEWNEWTDLLEWVLMSEGGHNTAPHMDSHGWSTWITIQEGRFGFGWLSRPTDKEQDAWMKDPMEYTGGDWRYVILKPGQTVFFPSGTVHFVFRLQAEQTLALGGHLLQWTSLELWVQVILYQLRNPNITNEDLGQAPLKYIRSARKLVDKRVATCRVASMGSMDNVTKFMALASVSTAMMNPSCSAKRVYGT